MGFEGPLLERERWLQFMRLDGVLRRYLRGIAAAGNSYNLQALSDRCCVRICDLGKRLRSAGSMTGFVSILCCAIAVIGVQGFGRGSPVADAHGSKEHWQWEALTQENFTLVYGHEFALCISMLSWCGEGRSLMRELTNLLKDEADEFAALHLRYVYIDKDRPLAKVLPASRSPTTYLFRNGTPYTYGGRLTGAHVLEAVRHGMSTGKTVFPVEFLDRAEDVKVFADSSDRGFLLLDFCGFARPVREKEEEARDATMGADSDVESEIERRRNDGSTSLAHEDESTKLLKQDRLVEDLDKAVLDVSSQIMEVTMGLRSWEEVFVLRQDENSTNGTTIQTKSEERKASKNGGAACTAAERRHFKVVYGNFTRLATRNALTPQRAKFGVVTNEAVAVEAGLVNNAQVSMPWQLLAVVQEPNRAPDVFDGEGDVDAFVDSVALGLVTELEGEGYHPHASASSALLNDTPSLLLFIDRASTSPEVRALSRAALAASRGAASHFATMAEVFEGDPEQASLAQPSRVALKKEMSHDELMEALIPRWLEQHKQLQVLDASDVLGFLKNVNLGSVQLQGESGNLVIQLKTDGQGGGSNSLLQGALAGRWKRKAPLSASDIIKFLMDAQQQSAHQAVPESDQLPAEEDDEASSASQFLELQGDTAFDTPEGVERESTSKGLEFLAHSDANFGGPDGHPDVMRDWMSADIHGAAGGQNLLPVQHAESEELLQDLSNPDMEGLEEDTEDDWETQGPESGDGFARNEQLTNSGQAGDDGDHGDIDSNAALPKRPEGQEGGSSYRNPNFQIGFFFRDGDDLLKEKLTMSTATPAVVILHPESEAHYVFPVNESITESSLIRFIDQFLLGQLEETVRSEPQRPGPPREGPRPPFVNRDFHDQNPVPHVTADMFNHEVLGLRDASSSSGAKHASESERVGEVNVGDVVGPAWRKDVVVLFTAPWCGFCKRMELVVQEVHRALSFYIGSFTGGCHNKGSHPTQRLGDAAATEKARRSGVDSSDDNACALPSVLQMDCTLNDCDHFLRPLIHPGETYPAVVLYPAQEKQAPIVYHGAPEVRSLYQFITANGPASARISGARRRYPGTEPVHLTTISIPVPAADRAATPAADRAATPAAEPPPVSHAAADTPLSGVDLADPVAALSAEPTQPRPGTLLLATARLKGKSLTMQKSVILVVHADEQAGVHGLILNKLLLWDNVVGALEAGELRGALRAAPLGYGGPGVVEGRPFFVLTRVPGLVGFAEVLPGVFYGEAAMSAAALVEVMESANLRSKDVWLFFGCASWSWAQLQGEVAEKLWHVREYGDGLIRWPPEWAT